MTGTMPKLAKSEQERFSNVFERQIWWIMTSAKLYTLCQRYLCNKKYARNECHTNQLLFINYL